MPMRSALRGRLLSGFSVREEREDYTHFRHLWVIQSVCVCVCVCVSVSVCVLVSVSVRVCVCVSDHVNVFVKNTVCDRDACGAQGPEYYSQNRLPVILPLLLDPVLSRARPHAHARALSHFLVLALSSPLASVRSLVLPLALLHSLTPPPRFPPSLSGFHTSTHTPRRLQSNTTNRLPPTYLTSATPTAGFRTVPTPSCPIPRSPLLPHPPFPPPFSSQSRRIPRAGDGRHSTYARLHKTTHTCGMASRPRLSFGWCGSRSSRCTKSSRSLTPPCPSPILWARSVSATASSVARCVYVKHVCARAHRGVCQPSAKHKHTRPAIRLSQMQIARRVCLHARRQPSPRNCHSTHTHTPCTRVCACPSCFPRTCAQPDKGIYEKIMGDGGMTGEDSALSGFGFVKKIPGAGLSLPLLHTFNFAYGHSLYGLLVGIT